MKKAVKYFFFTIGVSVYGALLYKLRRRQHRSCDDAACGRRFAV